MKPTVLSAFSLCILLGLCACTLPQDPVVSGRFAFGGDTAAGRLYYNHDDGYYYDTNLHRLPRGYRPPPHSHIDSIGGHAPYHSPYHGRHYPHYSSAPAQQYSGVRRLPHPQSAAGSVQRTNPHPRGYYVVPNWSEKQRRFRR